MGLKDHTEDVVVFFDFENIVYSLRNTLGENPNFELLMDKCQEYGRIVLARAYADWSRHNTVIAPLQASGFDPVYVPTYFYESKERKARKNAVDIHIAIEAIEVMFTQPHINTFVLLTGDKDFIPLANALRRNGKKVIAVGVQGTTSPYMRQATDDFVFYQQILEDPKSKKRKPLEKDIYKVLVDAVEKLKGEEQKTVFPQVKHTMTEILGSFNEKDYTDSKGANFSRFKDFILEAQRLGHVQLVTTGSVNEVLLPGDVRRAQEEEAKALAESDSPLPPEVTDTESAFDLLVWAVNHASDEGKSPRTSSIKTIMRSAQHNFDEKQLKNDKGEYFAKFSDFSRAAVRRGLVRIEGKGIRMEIHPYGDLAAVDAAQTKPVDDPTPVDSEQPPELDPAPVDNLATADLEQPPELDPVPVDDLVTADSELLSEVDPASDEIQLPDTDSLLMVEIPAIQETPLPPDSEPGEVEDLSPELITPPQEPYTYASDYRMRVLVVDALRNCKYPAPAHIIGQHCIEASEKRNISLPNRRLNQLLTSARKMGLLKEANNDGDEIQEFTFAENAQQIKLFLEDES